MTVYRGDILDSLSNEKRLYADIEISSNCPHCGLDVTYNFNDQYISYGELKDINFYCYDGCDHEWSIPAKILSAELTIEVGD